MCACTDDATGPAKLALTVKEDGTFHYVDGTDTGNPIDQNGAWRIDGRKLGPSMCRVCASPLPSAGAEDPLSFKTARKGRSYAPGPSVRYPCMKRFALFLALLVLLASCASSNGMVRKCDGKRGTRVPMGVL